MRRNKFKSRKFEKLEDRRLMVGDIDLDDGVLFIEGTDNDDVIIISENVQEQEIVVTISDRVTGEVLEDADYDIEDVARIEAFGLAGNDVIRNDTGIQARLVGDVGNDTLIGGRGVDTLEGGANNDTLEGRGGNDSLIGGANNDTYRFLGNLLGSDVVTEAANVDVDKLDFLGFTGGGVNVDLASTATRVINAGDLSLRLTSSTGIENVDGSNASDTIRGNTRDNVLRGFNERDFLFGRDGADDLFGGEGNDDLFGENGTDDLFGEGGIDNLDGGANADTLDGGFFAAQTGRDQLRGGSGADTFRRHRRLSQPSVRLEDMLDFNPAIDAAFTIFH